MKETKRTFTVELPHTNGLVATGTIERVGQEPANQSDLVKVRGTIFLPKENNTSYLPDSINFHCRVSILQESLHFSWGNSVDGHRKKEFTISQKKWTQAFSEAEERIKVELQKLIDALNKRHQALLDAEN